MARSTLIYFLLLLAACSPQEKTAEKKTPQTMEYRGMTYVIIPEGDYEVGEKDNPDNPLRKVHLKSYAIAIHETTNKQFAEFANATHYKSDAEKMGYGKTFEEGMVDWQWISENGANWRYPFGRDADSAVNKPDHPVTQISGADAEAYCTWAGLRLPTIDEWEVAARAGVKSLFPWGAELRQGKKSHANVWEGESHRKNKLDDGFMYTAPVRSFEPNAWGLYDVVGNVFEYCSGDQPGAEPDTADVYISGRGGSWWCSVNTCDYFNLVAIGSMVKHGSLANQGFRCVKDIPFKIPSE
ncbi:MAG: sulfatase-modifying factor protein [Bacteroidetes bacterium]|nr:MAG: sulfatase-modifying factor protein [Bacteroidota bacterium]